VIAAVLLALLALLTASCGDLQDPATATTPVTYLDAPPAHHPSPSLSAQAPEPASTDSMPSSGAQGAGQVATGQTQENNSQTTSEGMKSITLGWDPSVSQDVLGYKVYLVDVSNSAQEIIDVGSKTELAIPLRMGGSYGFTVTAYNSSFESQALPYLLFQVF